MRLTTRRPSPTTVAGYGPAATAANVTVAVVDDDEPPVVTVRARSESVMEGEEAVFILNRTGDTSYALTAELRNIVRIGDENVSNDPAQVTFQRDSDRVEFTVATEDDNLANMQPTRYRVRIANGEGYAIGEPGTATVTATDDDERLHRRHPGGRPAPGAGGRRGDAHCRDGDAECLAARRGYAVCMVSGLW